MVNVRKDVLIFKLNVESQLSSQCLQCPTEKRLGQGGREMEAESHPPAPAPLRGVLVWPLSQRKDFSPFKQVMQDALLVLPRRGLCAALGGCPRRSSAPRGRLAPAVNRQRPRIQTLSAPEHSILGPHPVAPRHLLPLPPRAYQIRACASGEGCLGRCCR